MSPRKTARVADTVYLWVTINRYAMACIALYDYGARDPEELTIKKNESLSVLDRSGTWWKVRNGQGASGLVPSNYVKESAPAPPASQQPSRTNLAEKEEPSHMYHQPDLMVRSNGPSLNIRAVAKYKYAGTREDELSLEKGDDVIVMEKEADGWWRGRCGTRIGWFPFNYVEELQETSDSTAHAAAAPPQEKTFICGVIALYSFNSGNPEELAFQKGDLMDIIDQPQDDPDWWEARKADGTTGLVPRNYVEVVHDAEPVFGASNAQPLTSRPTFPGPGPSSTQSRPAPPFAHEPWYHGRVARRDAEYLLNTQAQNGQFIVRDSETKVGHWCTQSVCGRCGLMTAVLMQVPQIC